jgi:hypothetical protein
MRLLKSTSDDNIQSDLKTQMILKFSSNHFVRGVFSINFALEIFNKPTEYFS